MRCRLREDGISWCFCSAENVFRDRLFINRMVHRLTDSLVFEDLLLGIQEHKAARHWLRYVCRVLVILGILGKVIQTDNAISIDQVNIARLKLKSTGLWIWNNLDSYFFQFRLFAPVIFVTGKGDVLVWLLVFDNPLTGSDWLFEVVLGRIVSIREGSISYEADWTNH